jgi:hypothetical protein
MTDSAATLMAIIFGLGVFAVIVAVGWRSVQNRRIVRLQGANGQETIIIADEGDEFTSVVTTTTEESPPAAILPVADANADRADPVPAPEFGRRAAGPETAI